MVDASVVSIPVEEPGAGGQPTLSLLYITKRFDGVAALTDVSFEVRPRFTPCSVRTARVSRR